MEQAKLRREYLDAVEGTRAHLNNIDIKERMAASPILRKYEEKKEIKKVSKPEKNIPMPGSGKTVSGSQRLLTQQYRNAERIMAYADYA